MAATGGFSFHVLGIRVSMRTVLRPAIAAILFGGLALYTLGPDASAKRIEHALSRVFRYPQWLALAFAAAIGFATYANGAHIAGGTDSSGYLSEARMWRAGTLHIETPLAREMQMQFASGQYAFTPGGFQPAGTGIAVPGYPPGLPLMLAAAGAIGGERAQFFVVPLCAAGLVVLAFAIGRALGGIDTGLISAAAVGASPILLFQATQPMSDVPAAFWWTVAIWLLIAGSPGRAVAAGVACGFACLVRPNLFALAPVLAAAAVWWHGWNRASLLRGGFFFAPVAITAAGFVYLQQTLFGAATRTGYGPVESLFAVDNVWRNLARYPRWAMFVQSALLLLALAGPLLLHRGVVSGRIDRSRATRMACSALVIFAVLQVQYLLYLVFDDWVYFRFLLPALPFVLVLQAVSLVAIAQRAPSSLRALAVLILAVLVASWGVGRARSLGAFALQDSERRYLAVTEFTSTLPPNSVYVTLQYAGSLWYYRAVPLLRWDWINTSEIDPAVDELTARQRHVYAVIDDWELPILRERYAGTRFVTRFARPVFEAGLPGGIKAQIYDVTDMTAAAAVSPVNSR